MMFTRNYPVKENGYLSKCTSDMNLHMRDGYKNEDT